MNPAKMNITINANAFRLQYAMPQYGIRSGNQDLRPLPPAINVIAIKPIQSANK